MWSYNRLIGLLLTTFLLFITPIYGQPFYLDDESDIRLVGGSYQWEGRVEIYFSGTWGTITDSEWSSDDARVVCRQLGHFKQGATAHSGAYFGEGSGPIHLYFVQCSGSEYNLTDCETQNSGISTSHSMDVGVKCQPADEAYREGDVHLVGGSHNWEGRVEIYWRGTWGTISDSSWSNTDARVVCSQLQHSISGVVHRCCAYYGEGSGTIHIREVVCHGSETSITKCDYLNNTVRTSHAQDVGVECQQGDTIKEGDVRLVGGSYLWQGRVEIFLSGVWGSFFYDRFYNYMEAIIMVVCRQLGYSTRDFDFYSYGLINGLLHDYLICDGMEHRITACQYTNVTVEHNYPGWGISCITENTPDNGDVRLSEGYSGLVEVLLSGSWQLVAVTDVSWTQANSEVVCRELGYVANGTGALQSQSSTSQSTADDHIDDVSCRGSEAKLTDCSHILSTLESYVYINMQCQQDDCSTGDTRLVGGGNEMEGRVEVCEDYRWGTVCDSQWTDNHTAVVCRHFGFNDTIGDSVYFTSEGFGRGTGPILMDYVNCNGSEPKLWRSCSHFTHYYGCSHSSEVGVRCQPASCSDGQIKLIGGTSQASGQVEICSNQRWETLSRSQWTNNVASVACTELGLLGSRPYLTHYGRGGGPIHPKYFQCTGTEARLSQCKSYSETLPRTHSDDAGMSCGLLMLNLTSS